MKNNFAMTIFTLIIMLAVTYISLATTDTTKKIDTKEQKIEITNNNETAQKPNIMKCGAGKCGSK